MPTIIPNSRTILSIYPSELEHFARHNGLITYKHPAAKKDAIIHRTYSPEWMSTINLKSVPKDEPMYRDVEKVVPMNEGYTLITVYDTFTWTRDFTQDSERFMSMPIPALDVARSLVTAWGSDVIEGNASMGPGIVVIEGDKPTLQELTGVRVRQTRYARQMINSATVMYAKNDVKSISDLHRQMAGWMNINGLQWVPQLEQVDFKFCKACGEKIRSQALRCKECNVDLTDFYVKHGIVPNELEDPAVFEFINKRIKDKNKVA